MTSPVTPVLRPVLRPVVTASAGPAARLADAFGPCPTVVRLGGGQ